MFFFLLYLIFQSTREGNDDLSLVPSTGQNISVILHEYMQCTGVRWEQWPLSSLSHVLWKWIFMLWAALNGLSIGESNAVIFGSYFGTLFCGLNHLLEAGLGSEVVQEWEFWAGVSRWCCWDGQEWPDHCVTLFPFPAGLDWARSAKKKTVWQPWNPPWHFGRD